MPAQSILKRLPLLLLLGLLSIVTGCSGGASGNASSSGQTIVVGSSNVALQIANTSLQISGTTTATASFKKADGTPASGVSVNFSTTLGTLTPASGIVPTDVNGVATITLTAGSTSGQGQLTASATVENKLVTTTALFSVNLPTLVLKNLKFTNNSSAGIPSISFGSSQGVSVDVVDAAGNPYKSPVDVVFTSTLSTQGKSSISSPVTTVNGTASTTYTAITATGTDTITASISGSSLSKALIINALDAGSISYVSALPLTIGLKGMGGLGVQETSKVTFKVVDTSGAPKINQPVTFVLNTNVGGLSLSASSGSTATDGTVSTIVQAGVVATPVRVTASTTVNGTTLSTQSDQLVISTGIPAQDGFSISSTLLNVEGWDFDGVTDKVTALLSDHFHNPVPDGTAVSFTTSCGSIQASCITVGGGCSVNWTSQSPRIRLGKCTILGYTIGEEDFLDANGNGLADGVCAATGDGTGLPPVTTCGEFHDYSEAFRDDNWNGVRDAGEAFIDYNGDGVFNGPDGLYTGILQGAQTAGSGRVTPKTKHVFMNHHLLITGSTPDTFQLDSLTINPAVLVCSNPPTCTSVSVLPVSTIRVLTVKDINGNPMPAGTTVTVSGLSATPSTFTVADGIPVVSPNVFDTFSFSLTAPSTGGGQIVSVVVKTPRGITTSGSFSISW